MVKVVCSILVRQIIIFSVMFFLLVAGVAVYVNQQIYEPPRRALQDYHLKRLQQPLAFGLRIREHQCAAGIVPCLLVEAVNYVKPAKRGRVLRAQLRSKGVHLAPYGTARGTIVLLHGRKGRKEDLLPVAERFVAAGFRCVLLDLPGHGDSALGHTNFGSTTFERSLIRKALNDVRQHFNLPTHEPAMLAGISMGAAFALSAAREAPDFWSAIVVINGFADLESVMQGVIKRHVPEKWEEPLIASFPFLDMAQWFRGRATLDAIRPEQWAKEVTTPALVIHSAEDTLVPDAQGKAIYNALASKDKYWISVEGAGHRNVLNTAMPLYAAMNAWLLQRASAP